MPLRIEADLELVIDDRPATLTGSGNVLRLTLSSPRILRSMRTVSLPNIGTAGDRAPTFKDMPGLLAAQGLTLEIADEKGLLLTLGAGAGGKSFTVPGLGRLEHLAIGSPGAALRLLSSL